ncbi:carboxypeptidase-like regulatory domain-containing protein [Maribellus sp. YY47]|uniref:carboxypeptidase-like regulatory domain-containing protein n=1 Tax=Maribellus sp. YY47 TaxID=2929486 RepID=UPI002000CA5A|nr:carboxypeptidase-like regulatory domain-containing protein [Maribellus sp. YY47]MCK3685820.1 carboxypeptidase-like regulatory domain-containing protein [Maribellus sp. YY47]
MQVKTIFSFIILANVALFTFAQQGSKVAHVLKGKVINAETNQPVSYTNIGLEGTLYGTASNEEGSFELKIPEDLASKKIFFSAVGFQNRLFPLSELSGKEFNVIKLRPQSYDVDKVDVAGQNMVLIRILRMASENIRYNYGAGPFNLHCSYSKESTVNDTTHNKTTASVLVYDKNGYSTPSPINEYQSRKYRVTNESEGSYSFSSNLLRVDELLAYDWVRSASAILNPGLLNDYQLTLISQPNIGGKEYWVIAFKQNQPTLEASGDFYASSFEGEITINKEDYAVLNIKGKVTAPKNNRQDRSLAVASGAKDYLQNVSYEFTTTYRDLLIHDISMSKSYNYKGDHYSEKYSLSVNRAHANSLTVLNSRNYFPGE